MLSGAAGPLQPLAYRILGQSSLLKRQGAELQRGFGGLGDDLGRTQLAQMLGMAVVAGAGEDRQMRPGAMGGGDQMTGGGRIVQRHHQGLGVAGRQLLQQFDAAGIAIMHRPSGAAFGRHGFGLGIQRHPGICSASSRLAIMRPTRP